MPVPFPQTVGNDRTDIQNFLDYVQKLLDELTRDAEPADGGPTFVRARLIAQLANSAREAWQEARPVYETLYGRIPDLTNAALDAHGLLGAQLRFKLATIRFFNEQYTAVGRRVLKKLFDVIDILLKSILAVVGAGEGAAEIKDYIKEALDLDG